MKITVVISTDKRQELLTACVESVVDSASFAIKSGLNFDYEVLVAFNGDSDGYTKYSIKNDSVKKFWFEKSSPSKIRNKLIQNIGITTYVLFLDDDIRLPVNYFKIALEYLIKFDVAVLGGSDACYEDVNQFEILLNYTIQSPFVTFVTRKRHMLQAKTFLATETSLTLANLWIKADVITEENFFQEEYVRNEENVLLDRLVLKGLKIVHLANLFVFHKRRSDLNNFLYPSFMSGFYRMKSIYEKPSFSKIVFLIPPSFFLYNLFAIFFMRLEPFIPLGIYLMLVLGYSLVVALKERKIIYFLALFFLQPLVISSYALGQLSFFLKKEES